LRGVIYKIELFLRYPEKFVVASAKTIENPWRANRHPLPARGIKESGSKDFKEGCNAILGKKDETGGTRDLQRDPPNRPWITCWLIDV
jgi:hypothetical protein